MSLPERRTPSLRPARWARPQPPAGLSLQAADVPLPHGRTLRVGLYLRDGEPDALILAVGEGDGADWRENRDRGLTLPGAVLPALIGALERLDRPGRRMVRG